jgi:transglutaminase-like putative cysteine protease
MNSAGETTLLRISHVTHYTYAETVEYSDHKAFLTPRSTDFQQLVANDVSIEPEAKGYSTNVDYFGNRFSTFALDTPHTELRVEARSELRLPAGAVDGSTVVCGGDLDAVQRRLRNQESREDLAAYEFLFDSPHVWQSQDFARYAADCFPAGQDALVGVRELMHRIHSEFRYDPAVTTVSTPISEVLALKSGVCQDFAHLMIACLRSVGVPARYVSGYLVPGQGVIGAQASHAWISVYCPGLGWTDFDPTNDVSPSGRHITLAWGRDFSDVSPFRGVVVGGGDHTIAVEVLVS